MEHILEVKVSTLKKMILGEIKEHIKEAKNIMYRAYPPDVQKELINIAERDLLNRLDKCQTLEDLDEFIGYAGYRMSLQDWLDSY